MAAPQISFRPFFEVSNVYDTGLSGVGIINPQGGLANTAAYGVEATGGISGAHRWRRTTLGLDYSGSVRHYTRRTFFDGSDHSLLLGVTHQTSRHSSFTLRQSAGIFSRNFGLLGLPQTVPFDPTTTFVPTTDFFDNRTSYLSTQGDFTLQKSLRLSFNLGGSGFLARRRSSALYGVTGGGAHADVQYRVGRFTTIGANYTYTHFGFTRILSSTDIHGFAGTFAKQFTPRLELSGYVGLLRAEIQHLQNVPLDPVVAVIIGRSVGVTVAHRILHAPNVGARLSRTFRQGVAYLSGGRAISAGNGLFLTSEMTSVAAGYTYTGLRRWSFAAQASLQRGDSLANVLGGYNSYGGGVQFRRQLGRAFHLSGRFNVRKYSSANFDGYNRLIHRTTLGIGFSPGDVPLRIW
jgi:hypothetical protein